jgi:hypothetical protein
MGDGDSTQGSAEPDSDLDRLLRDLAKAPKPDLGLAPVFEIGGTERFRVLRRLGAGGFGVVWLVRDLSMDADVALKTIPPGRPEFVYRLKREFRALADLRHENLVAYYELFAEHEKCFFTMEYVPGCTFLDFVRPGNRLDDERLRTALEQLVRGLQALHAAGKLHRDIKPSNVLVAPSGRLVLLDFNLATEVEETSLGRSAELVGTPAYMSPEHALAEPLSPASDWYSVGVMLYEALTGRLPFKGSWRHLVEEKAGPVDLPSPASLVPGLDRELVDLCMALLSRRSERRPGADGLAAALGRTAARGGKPDGAAPDALVGREQEMKTLRGALRATRSGVGVSVLVEGASGVGKTALVRAFLGWAERSERAVVLRGRCYERERVPYQGIDSLVDDLCRLLNGLSAPEVEALLPRRAAALVQLFPVMVRVPTVAARRPHQAVPAADQQELRRQAFVALRELLARAADRFPLVLHVDDLQWGDLDTAALIQELLRPPDAPGMLLILGYRSEDVARSPCLQVLARAEVGRVSRLWLGPLRAAEAEALARNLLGDRQQHLDVTRLAAESGGNPLFIQELVRYASLGGTGYADLGSLDLETALRNRIDRLSPDARRLLEVVAVAGRPMPEPTVRRAASHSGPPWQAWDALRSAHLVRFVGPQGGQEVEPFHDRIREVVVASLAPGAAAECHRGLAEALEEQGGADPEELARHHGGAGSVARARQLALIAGSQAEQALAFDRASRLLQWALDLDPGDPREQASLRASLAGALANAGRGLAAARVFLQAAEGAEPLVRQQLRRRAADQLFLSGRIDEAVALSTEDLRAAGLAFPKSPLRALALLVLRRVYIRLRGLAFRERSESEIPPARLALIDHLWSVDRGLSMVDIMRGADYGARYMILALRAGEPRRVAQGLALEAGHAASVSPTSKRTRALMQKLDEFAERLRDPKVRGLALLVRGIRAYCACQWREAVTFCDESGRTFSEGCTGAIWEIWTMRSFAATSLFYLGEWADLARRVQAQAAEARGRGNAYGLAVSHLPYGVLAWLAAGDLEGARAATREAISAWSPRGFHLQHFWFLLAETIIDLYQGDAVRARRRLLERWPALARSLLLRIPSVRTPAIYLRGGCALAALDAEGSSRAALLGEARHSLRLLESASLGTSAPLASVLRVALSGREGRLEEARRQLERADAEMRGRQMLAHAAAARWRGTRMLGAPPPDQFLAGQSVADPDALARALLPGFPAPS